MQIRRLRNRLVHEYVEDPRGLAEALAQAGAFVPVLLQPAERLLVALERRGLRTEPA